MSIQVQVTRDEIVEAIFKYVDAEYPGMDAEKVVIDIQRSRLKGATVYCKKSNVPLTTVEKIDDSAFFSSETTVELNRSDYEWLIDQARQKGAVQKEVVPCVQDETGETET